MEESLTLEQQGEAAREFVAGLVRVDTGGITRADLRGFDYRFRRDDYGNIAVILNPYPKLCGLIRVRVFERQLKSGFHNQHSHRKFFRDRFFGATLRRSGNAALHDRVGNGQTAGQFDGRNDWRNGYYHRQA